MVSPPPAITLKPNEIGYTSISVASPRIFNDPGSARTIDIEAYSIYSPNQVYNNSVTLITRGIYVSELNQAVFIAIGLIILLCVIFIFYRRRIKIAKICGKPDKPWTLPEV